MVPLVKFLCLGKKSYEQKRRGRYFAQNQFFYDIVGLLKWRSLLQIVYNTCSNLKEN